MLPEDPSGHCKHGVATGVAPAVIDALEIIQVYDSEADRHVMPHGERDQVMSAFEKMAAIGTAGERVDRRQLGQSRVAALRSAVRSVISRSKDFCRRRR